MLIDEYNEEKTCKYKGEHYSVRDNGAVMRHQQEGKSPRKNDNVWTFGKFNVKTGYREIGGERVHRIVAVAFHGNPPTDQHVVDHIDTNRSNNRPDNLRWLTKLENALNNPITRAKIEMICGSIEAFIENPALLRGHESENPNFSWMRTVTPEEANTSYERLMEWTKKTIEERISSNRGDGIGEWIYNPKNEMPKEPEKPMENTKQWKKTVIDRTEYSGFPLAPTTTKEGEDVIQKYREALVNNAIFLQSRDYWTVVRDVNFFAKENKLRVLTEREKAQKMFWYVFEIWADDHTIYHQSVGNYSKNNRKAAEEALHDLTKFYKQEWKYKKNSEEVKKPIQFPINLNKTSIPKPLPLEVKKYFPAENIEQRNWATPTEFPMCPKNMSDNPLETYMEHMIKGDIFCRNRYGESVLVDVGYTPNKDTLIILTYQADGIKKWYLCRVYMENEFYIHESIGSYFTEDGGRKYFTINTGGKWTGGEVFDDYC